MRWRTRSRSIRAISSRLPSGARRRRRFWWKPFKCFADGDRPIVMRRFSRDALGVRELLRWGWEEHADGEDDDRADQREPRKSDLERRGGENVWSAQEIHQIDVQPAEIDR